MILTGRNDIMNIVPRHVEQLAAICALAIASPQPASASGSGNGAAFRLAMGPMSAAQKNQGTPGKSDEVAVEPRHHAKHWHAHHAM
jgi:hypothetical protein